MSDEIRTLEEQRRLAMLAGDSDKLTQMCSAKLAYVHSNGELDSCRSYLDRVADGFFVYHELSFDVDTVDVYGDAALVHGRVKGKVNVSGNIRHLDCIYLAAWAREGDEWKFRAFQPTPIL